MNLEEILQERLTNDKTAEAVESNYRELIKVKGIERDIEQERLIKLNRLERKEEPMKVRGEKYFYGTNYYCPVCGERYETWAQHDKYCRNCGQRLML